MWDEAESANIKQVTGEARPELKVGEKAGQRDVLARCGRWRAPVGVEGSDHILVEGSEPVWGRDGR